MDSDTTMNTDAHRHDGSRLAFTLVELLTVITIMGIVAALVVTMGQAAAQKKKLVAVDGAKHRLITIIENYHNKLNYYPPDNGALVSNTLSGYNYGTWAATNPLIYELTGATNFNDGANLALFNTANVTSLDYAKVFNRAGVGNGDALEPHNFFQPGPSPKEYAQYAIFGTNRICGLIAPTELVPGNTNNFVHYDSSTTNRHNMNSYDIWFEFSIGTKNGKLTIITNGNW
jgi:prepilin-type N-terminal cleavage/methylation domain-containing protein